MALLSNEKPGSSQNETVPQVTVTTVTLPEKALYTETSKEALYADDLERGDSNLASVHSYHDKASFDTDVEAVAILPVNSSASCPRKSMSAPRNDCQIWPGKDHWKQKARAAKRERSCTCLARLNKRNRNIVKIVLILLVIGIAVGVGVGISKALGAPMWGERDEDKRS